MKTIDVTDEEYDKVMETRAEKFYHPRHPEYGFIGLCAAGVSLILGIFLNNPIYPLIGVCTVVCCLVANLITAIKDSRAIDAIKHQMMAADKGQGNGTNTMQ